MKSLLAFLLLLFGASQAQAAQVAIVRKAKAIIYADLDLKSPIGYVRKGKELAVGKVKRRRGEVLPVLVNGKIGWVRVDDISLPEEIKSFDQDRKVKEHKLFFADDKVKDPLSENNYLTLRTGPANLSLSTRNDESGEESLDVSSASETSLMFNHKNPYHQVNWGVGFEYVTGTRNFFAYQSINIKGGLAWVPIRLKLLSVEGYANLALSGDFRIESQNVGVYKGNMYGIDTGIAVRLFPESQFGIMAGLGYTQYRLIGLGDIENDEDDVRTDFSSISGTKLFAGLSYRF